MKSSIEEKTMNLSDIKRFIYIRGFQDGKERVTKAAVKSFCEACIDKCNRSSHCLRLTEFEESISNNLKGRKK